MLSKINGSTPKNRQYFQSSKTQKAQAFTSNLVVQSTGKNPIEVFPIVFNRLKHKLIKGYNQKVTSTPLENGNAFELVCDKMKSKDELQKIADSFNYQLETSKTNIKVFVKP